MISVLDPAYQYWKNILQMQSTALPVSSLEPEFYEVYDSIEDVEFQNLVKAANDSQRNMFVLLLSAVSIVLRKYSGHEKVQIGVPVMNGVQEKDDKILLLLHSILWNNTVREVVSQIGNNYALCCKHQEFPIALLEDELERRCRYDAFLQLEELHKKSEGNNAPLNMTFKRTNQSLEMRVMYDKTKFQHQDILEIIQFFKVTLAEIISRRSDELVDLSIGCDNKTYENKLLIGDVLNRMGAIDTELEKSCTLNAKKTAIADQNDEITYEELWEESAKIALYLRDCGLVKGDVVGVHALREIDTIIAMVGILRAGGCFVLIDENVPQGRMDYYIENSNAKLFFTKNQKMVTHIKTVNVQSIKNIHYESMELKVNSGKNDPAYILYTSGSTGLPKGVMVSQVSILNLVLSLQRYIFLEKKEPFRIGLVTSFSFDPTIMQIFVSLLSGYTLDIIPKNVFADGALLYKHIKNKNMDSLAGTPAHLRLLIEGNRLKEKEICLSSILTGGEALDVMLVKEFGNVFPVNTPKVVNLYGPTETCVASTFHVVDMERLDNQIGIPIGKPMLNTDIYILDQDMKAVPRGESGEIYIGGKGVALGYIGNPDETTKRFITDPFHVDGVIYRTGDMGRWNGEGYLEFIGRIDSQVKVRGYRIELGEIEAVIRRQKQVKDAAVITNGEGENIELIAFVVVEALEEITQYMKEHLKKVLPLYMIPARFISIDKVPVNINGKADKKSLLENIKSSGVIIQPRNKTEQEMHQIWVELLNRDEFGITEDFFSLGGHSLKVMKMSTMIYEKFNCEIPLSVLLEQGNIEQISSYIEQNIGSDKEMFFEIATDEYFEMTAVQNRIYVAHKMDRSGIAYNTPMLLKIEGYVHEDKLNAAMNCVIKRHEILRTVFVHRDQVIMQKSIAEINFCVNTANLEEDEVEEHCRRCITPFDLEQGPLLRCFLMNVKADTAYLLIDMHHIITDLISVGLFWEEVIRLYNGENLHKVKMQYRSFADLQNRRLKAGEYEQKRAFWLEEFSGGIPMLHLPTDYTKPTISKGKGGSLYTVIEADITNSLRTLAGEKGVTVNMILLSCYCILLSKYASKEEIIIGIPVAARTLPGVEGVMGPILNTVLFRIAAASDLCYSQFLVQVKEKLIRVLENQDYPLDLLVEELGKTHTINRGNIYEAGYNFYSKEFELDLKGGNFKDLKIEQVDFEYAVAHTNIEVICRELTDEIKISAGYLLEIYDQDFVKYFLAHYIEMIKSIIDSPNDQIKELNMLTVEEKGELLYGIGE